MRAEAHAEEGAVMWIPILSATILQALFGNQLFGTPNAEPGPAADYARRAGAS